MYLSRFFEWYSSLKRDTMLRLATIIFLVALSTSLDYQPCQTHECWQDGLFQEGKCSEVFCQCSNGNGTLVQCPSGLFFNPITLVCDYPENIQECNTNAPSTPTTTPTTTSTTTLTTTKNITITTATITTKTTTTTTSTTTSSTTTSNSATTTTTTNVNCPSGWFPGPAGLGCVLMQVAITNHICDNIRKEIKCAGHQICYSSCIVDWITDLGRGCWKLLEKLPSASGRNHKWGTTRLYQVSEEGQSFPL